MGTKRNSTITKRARLANTGMKAGISPRKKAAKGSLKAGAIMQGLEQPIMKGTVVPKPPAPSL